MSANRFEQIAAYGVFRVAQAFGGVLHDRTHLSPCPACNETRRSRSDRRQGPVFVMEDRAWKCGICDARGDAASWIAVKLTGGVPGKGDPRWAEVLTQAAAAGFCDAPESVGMALPPRPPPPPPAPPAPIVRPPQADIDALLRAARPCVEDADVCEWLSTRLGPAVAGMVRVRENVGAIPRTATGLPEWARGWPEKGYRAVFRCFDANGYVQSAKVRRIHRGEGASSKPPFGFDIRGLVFANPIAEDMLRGADMPAHLIIVEGEPAFLAWCAAAPSGAAVIGIFNGSWTPEHAARVPADTEILISTDHGDAKGTGDGYASKIADTMPDRVISRWRWESDPTRQPDDVVLTHGIEALRWSDCYEWSRPAPPELAAVEAPEAPEAPAPGPNPAEGLARLRALCARLTELAGDTTAKPTDRADAVRALLQDEAVCGAAWLAHKSEIRLEIERIGALPRCSALRQSLTTAFRAAGETASARAKEARAVARAERDFRVISTAAPAAAAPPGGGPPPPNKGGGAPGAGGGGGEIDYNALVPPGYTVDDSGVWKDGDDDDAGPVRVALGPIYVLDIAVDVHSGAHALRLRWRDGKRWIVRSFPTETIASARTITGLAGQDGFPVSSVTASGIVAYLEAARLYVRNQGKGADVSRVFGWQQVGEDEDSPAGFLLGRRFIGPDGEVPDSEAPITYDPQDDREMSRFANAYRERGTWEGWLQLAEKIKDYPRVALAVLASLAAPMLRYIPTQKGFVVDYAGVTSQGKTTTLRCAGSVWGRPSDGGGGVIHTWGSSLIWIERHASVQTDLPFIIDDTKRAKPGTLSAAVYMLAQGQGEGRATRNGGTREMRNWRTVTLSTGEAPLVSYGQDGGAAARVLSLWGSPLGGEGAKGAAVAAELSILANQHYGHAGARLVRWLQGPANQASIQSWYAEALAKLTDKAGGNAVASRASGYLALLAVAQRVASEGLGIPDFGDGPLLVAWEALVGASEGADMARRALRDVYDWAVANQPAFWGRVDQGGASQSVSRAREWLGVWQPGAGLVGKFAIGILTKPLRAQLDTLGYEPDAILRTWADRGWLAVDSQGKRQVLSRIDGVPARVVGLTADAIAEVVAHAEPSATD